ncbi:MAG: TA system VapC family ribonuclease toxin [Acidimicrobiales bacterium]
MTATLDTNVLVAAAHESGPRQERARALLDWVADGPGVVHLLWPTLIGFLRIVTHPTIFARPLSPEDAGSAVERLVSRPHIRVGGELDEFWRNYRRVAGDVKPRGNLVPDAHLVALMLQHGISTIWSNDRDLRKFSGITVKDPYDDRYSTGFA